MHVAEIWRYPVKSMAGERLAHAVLGSLGIPGDRAFYVVDGAGRVQTARTRSKLLLHRGHQEDDGSVRIDGLPWDDPVIAARVRAAAGPSARLVPATGAERFDVLPLLVTSDGAIATLGIDGRRLRPNLVIGGVDGLKERAWEGRFLAIGHAMIGLADLRDRCVMTTFDPDTGVQDVGVLKEIRRRFAGSFALNAWVVRPGRIAVGDAVTLHETFDAALPPERGRFA